MKHTVKWSTFKEVSQGFLYDTNAFKLSECDGKRAAGTILHSPDFSFFSGYLSFYFIKMLIISYKFQERSEGADEILIWIPQTSVAIGSTIFFISVLHQFVLSINKD